MCMSNVDCLEHKPANYIQLARDRREKLTNDQYVVYVPLSLAGSMQKADLYKEVVGVKSRVWDWQT